MQSTFKNIGLIGKCDIPNISETINNVYNILNQLNVTIRLESKTASFLKNCSSQTHDLKDFGDKCDLLIVIGGDGSLLNAARSAFAFNVPILGINRGRLGFLADLTPVDLEKPLTSILAGHYVLEERLRLQAQVKHEGNIIYQEYATNDIVIKQGDIPSMLIFDIYVDNHCIAREHADGLIAATPTGSTAYALSGGGPILHPGLDAYLLLSMFSHTLSNRPVIVPAQLGAEINISLENKAHASIRCDGLDMVKIPPGSSVSIAKVTQKLLLLHPKNYNYFDNLRSKLNWGGKL